MILSFRKLAELTGLGYRLIHSWVESGIVPSTEAAQYGKNAKLRDYEDDGLLALAVAAFLSKKLHLKGAGVRAAVRNSVRSVRSGRACLAILKNQGQVWIEVDPPVIPEADDEENGCICFDLAALDGLVGNLKPGFDEFPSPPEVFRTKASQ